MTYVYAIVHPVTRQRQYVGCTRSPEVRLRQHIYNSHNLDLRKWINKLLKRGMTPEMEILQKGKNVGAHTEWRWIGRCRLENPDLFNRIGPQDWQMKRWVIKGVKACR